MKNTLQMTILTLALIAFNPAFSDDWVNIQDFTESDPGNPSFGESISVSTNYMAIGKPTENSDVGAVYIYKKDNNGSWQPFQKIETIADIEISSINKYEFKSIGQDVAVTDNGTNATLVIGAPESLRWQFLVSIHGGYWEDYDAAGLLIYELNTTSNEFELATNYYENGYNTLGYSVDIAYRAETVTESITVAGHTSYYDLPVTVSVVVSGAPADDKVNIYSSRHASATYNNISWNPQGINGTTSGAQFGYSVALDKDASHFIVGSPYEDVIYTNPITGGTSTFTDKGYAYIYKLQGSDYDGYIFTTVKTIQQYIPSIVFDTYANDECHFGIAVDINNDKAIVGAESEGLSNKMLLIGGGYYYPVNDGEAVIFSLDTGTDNDWTRGSTLKSNYVNNPDDGFGFKVVIENERAIIGAPTLNDGTTTTGGVFIFDSNIEVSALIPETAGSYGSDVAYSAEQLFIGDADNDEVTISEYKNTIVNPALIMYLLN